MRETEQITRAPSQLQMYLGGISWLIYKYRARCDSHLSGFPHGEEGAQPMHAAGWGGTALAEAVPHCPCPSSRNRAGDCGLDPGHRCIPTTCGTAALGARECPGETPSCPSLVAWWCQRGKGEAEPSPRLHGVLWWVPCLAAIRWGWDEHGPKNSLPLQTSCSTGHRASPSPPAPPRTSSVTPAPGWGLESGPGAAGIVPL